MSTFWKPIWIRFRVRQWVKLLLGVVAVSVIAMLLLRDHDKPAPAISIGVLKYDLSAGRSPSWSVRIGITNTGRIAIQYNRFTFSYFTRLRIQSNDKWSLHYNDPYAAGVLDLAVLMPGKDTYALVCLPPGTRRWQIRYTFRTASLRERVSSRVPTKWQRTLRPVLRHISDEPGCEYEVWSSTFECPSQPMPPAEDVLTADFESEPLADGLRPE